MIDWTSLESIVVFRTDHIGDLILSTCFFRALRQSAPRARLTAVVPNCARGVLEHSGLVDECISLEHWSPVGKTYGAAIALSPRTATYKLASATKARIRAGYYYSERPLAKLGCRWWLTHSLGLPIRKLLVSGQRVPHEIEQHRLFADHLGLVSLPLQTELPVLGQDLEWAKTLPNGPLVGLHLSPNWLSGGWSVEQLADLCRTIPQCIVSAGPAEARLVNQLQSLQPWEVPIYSGLSLSRWAALLGACRVVVSTDTGAVHVAASQGRPVVVAFKPDQEDICSQQWHPWAVPFRRVTLGDYERTKLSILEALGGLTSVVDLGLSPHCTS